ncbi:MAG: hypothetical protein EOP45_06090, partial [Sphingobacteriaceae bacterium]
MEYQKHLKELRSKLAGQQLSLLVGAGLSRNVSDKFLNWEELLVDLAYELHKSAIDAAFSQHVKSGITSQSTEIEFIKARCIEHIRQDGYLDIVSAFIKRKGYSESITTYIEDHIPNTFIKEGKVYLELNGDTEELPKEKLSLHQSLVDLPWNNIYTTNYDNLLDICIDNDRYETLLNEISGLQSDIQNAEQNLQNITEELEELSQRDQSSRPNSNGNDPTEEVPVFTNNDNPIDKPSASEHQPQINLQEMKSKLNNQRYVAKHNINKLEMLLRAKELELQRCYQVVKSAAGLRIKKQKNIIKLHGSLRSATERQNFNFDFDGDHKNQYVIAKEDYENYPKNHEAFTQLMRISLLQESFCLLGFSGVDPNFLEWINWVRDILHKAARTETKNKNYKIYLVDASNNAVPKDVQLFYENHNIIRIPLLDPQIVSIIEEDLGHSLGTKDDDRRTALEAFILYLSNDEDVKVDIPSANISVKKEYKNIWGALNIYDPDKIPEEEILHPIVEKLDAIEGKFWLPNLDYANIHNQQSLVDYTFMFGWDKKFKERPQLLRLLRHAIKGIYLPIENLIPDTVINLFLEDNHLAKKVQPLIDRNKALSADKTVQLPNIHDKILQAAFSFQFSKLHESLTSWEAKGKEIIVKAGFLALLDTKQAVDTLQ